MQPAPLAGTATSQIAIAISAALGDATRTPRGDGNRNATTSSGLLRAMQPAPLTGTATPTRSGSQETSSFDATRTPYGDGNLAVRITLRVLGMRCNPHPSRGRQPVVNSVELLDAHLRCNPHPSRGRQLLGNFLKLILVADATRTPYGDGNSLSKFEALADRDAVAEMQPAPLTGTATRRPRRPSAQCRCRCNPHPSRGRQLNGILVELLVVQM